MSDHLATGRRFRVLNIIDHFTRECVDQPTDTSISGVRIVRFMDSLGRLPKTIVCDNGLELTSKATFFWAKKRNITLQFIQPRMRLSNRSMAGSGNTVWTCTGFEISKKPDMGSTRGANTITKSGPSSRWAECRPAYLRGGRHEH